MGHDQGRWSGDGQVIERRQGDILKSNADLIFIAVNRVGVMGKGLALQFKKRYPNLFEEYQVICDQTDLFDFPEMVLVWSGKQMFCLFPTKEHWRQRSDIGQIERYLRVQFEQIHDDISYQPAKGGAFSIARVAIPPLGAGLGGLDKNEILCMIERVWRESGNDETRTLLLYEGE